MDASLITAFGAVLVAVIGAVGSVMLQLRNAKVTRDIAVKTDAIVEKSEIIVETQGKIHVDTNSRLARIEAENKNIREQLSAALAAAHVAETARAVLAAEAAAALAAPPPPSPAAPPPRGKDQ